MSLKLHVFPPSPRAFKVLFAANQLGVDYDLQFINLFKGEQNSPEYRALNPHGRMPTLEDDGFVLWESNAIVNYLASKKPEAGLLPHDDKERLRSRSGSTGNPTTGIRPARCSSSSAW